MGLSAVISVPVCKFAGLSEGKQRFLSQPFISTRLAEGYSEK